VLGGANHRPGAGRGQAVRDHQRPAGGEDLRRPGPQPVPQRQLGAAEAGGDGVAVAAERDARPVIGCPGDLDRRGVGDRGQRQQGLGGGELADGRPGRPLPAGELARVGVTPGRAQPGVPGGGPEPVQADLRFLGGGGGHGAPPPAAAELHPALHGALAVPPPRRARDDDRAVMLGDRGEAGLDIGAARHDHRGQPVGPPVAGGAAQAPHHRVHRLDQVRLIHRLGQHAAGPARVRQRAEQHIRRPGPRRPAPLEPVPLDLLTRRMADLDRLPAPHARARLAVRPQAREAQLPGEAHIRPVITQRHDLIEQRRHPQMRIISEPRRHIRRERRQRIRASRPADPRHPLPGQIRPDRLAVTTKMTGDSRDRPSPPRQCACFHVFSH
jgi:hypothetical protein